MPAEIVVDTSAFVAMFKHEEHEEVVSRCLLQAKRVLVPACCFVELALLKRLHSDLLGWAQDLCVRSNYDLVELSLSEARLAVTAAQAFGKGSGHPAQLNFGDCLVYAAAKHRDLPLLYVGEDFRHTDIAPALTQD